MPDDRLDFRILESWKLRARQSVTPAINVFANAQVQLSLAIHRASIKLTGMQPLPRRSFLGSLWGAMALLHGADRRCEPVVQSEPWSRFRGPNASGIGAGTGYPV